MVVRVIPGLRAVAVALALMMALSMMPTLGVSAQEVEPPANAEELAELEGDILIDGSSTVFPITAAAAEEFEQFATDVRITVGISGSGGGFSRFCRGETDWSNASRPMKPSEVEQCEENGIEFIELPVAFDGLTVVINPENDWVSCLTVDELKTIWEPEAEGQITNWNQIRADFPDMALSLYGPGTDSGTFDYFTEAVVGEAQSSRGDFQPSEDDNVLVQGVAGDEGALGFFGYAYYSENSDILTAVAIDAGDGNCVLPSPETVNDGSYQPLSRPLFVYVRADAADRPEVAAFVKFMLSPSFTPLLQTPEIGYVELPEQFYTAANERFDNRVTGTLYPEGAEIGGTLERFLDNGETDATPEA